jgi:hypothetical protein
MVWCSFVFICTGYHLNARVCVVFNLNKFAGDLAKWEALEPNGEIPDFSLEPMQIGLDKM